MDVDKLAEAERVNYYRKNRTFCIIILADKPTHDNTMCSTVWQACNGRIYH